MKKNWRKISLILLDTVLAVYLLLAITAFNTPKDSGQTCEEVVINISDENTNGFLSPNDVRKLENQDLIPDEEGGNSYYLNGGYVKLSDAGKSVKSAENTPDNRRKK